MYSTWATRTPGQGGQLGVEGRIGQPRPEGEQGAYRDHGDDQDSGEPGRRHREDAAEEKALDVDRGRGCGAQAETDDAEGEGHGVEDAGRDVGPETRPPTHERRTERDEDDEGQGHHERLVHAGAQEQPQGESPEGRVGEAIGEEGEAALDHEQAEEAARRRHGHPREQGPAKEVVGQRIEQEVHAQSSSHTATPASSWSCPRNARGRRAWSRRTSSGSPAATTVRSR